MLKTLPCTTLNPSLACAGVSAVGVAMVASAAKSLLIKTCSDKNTHNAKVRGMRGVGC